MEKEMKLNSQRVRDNINHQKVMESFLWFSFSKLSQEELVSNLKEYRETLRKTLMDNEKEWIGKKDTQKKIKDEYIEDVKVVIDNETNKNMLHIQKIVKELHLDKDSWKLRLGL